MGCAVVGALALSPKSEARLPASLGPFPVIFQAMPKGDIGVASWYGSERLNFVRGGQGMNRGLKATEFALLVIAGLLAIPITMTIGWRPFLGPQERPLTNRTFERTPQRLERGRYLASSLLGCMDCHSVRDRTKPGARIVNGMMGAGDIIPVKGMPGRLVAPNLTPDPETGVGDWTDDQLARATREGVGHDGRALFPLMPYPSYRRLSDEDLASVIVFLRSLPPVRHPLPKSSLFFR
jgi:hypothetical protein